VPQSTCGAGEMPGMRALKVVEPPLSGGDIARLQAALSIPQTRVYDAKTAAAVDAWKWRVGFRQQQVNGTIAARGQRWRERGHFRRTSSSARSSVSTTPSWP
jgi:hypothetical protein